MYRTNGILHRKRSSSMKVHPHSSARPFHQVLLILPSSTSSTLPFARGLGLRDRDQVCLGSASEYGCHWTPLFACTYLLKAVSSPLYFVASIYNHPILVSLCNHLALNLFRQCLTVTRAVSYSSKSAVALLNFMWLDGVAGISRCDDPGHYLVIFDRFENGGFVSGQRR